MNREDIRRVDSLIFSHLDPDHVEGFRVVEQIALDFRSWKAYPEKQIRLLLQEELAERIASIQSQYGPVIDFYRESGFVYIEIFKGEIQVEDVHITAIPIDGGSQISFVHVFEQNGQRVVYAPCDIKPFPEHRIEVQKPDLLIIQPGIFETGLKHDFEYPPDHISRTTLYTFEDTLQLAERLGARQVLFVHLEEYWNRSYDDYSALESADGRISFAYDGMEINI